MQQQQQPLAARFEAALPLELRRQNRDAWLAAVAAVCTWPSTLAGGAGVATVDLSHMDVDDKVVRAVLEAVVRTARTCPTGGLTITVSLRGNGKVTDESASACALLLDAANGVARLDLFGTAMTERGAAVVGRAASRLAVKPEVVLPGGQLLDSATASSGPNGAGAGGGTTTTTTSTGPLGAGALRVLGGGGGASASETTNSSAAGRGAHRGTTPGSVDITALRRRRDDMFRQEGVHSLEEANRKADAIESRLSSAVSTASSDGGGSPHSGTRRPPSTQVAGGNNNTNQPSNQQNKSKQAKDDGGDAAATAASPPQAVRQQQQQRQSAAAATGARQDGSAAPTASPQQAQQQRQSQQQQPLPAESSGSPSSPAPLPRQSTAVPTGPTTTTQQQRSSSAAAAPPAAAGGSAKPAADAAGSKSSNRPSASAADHQAHKARPQHQQQQHQQQQQQPSSRRLSSTPSGPSAGAAAATGFGAAVPHSPGSVESSIGADSGRQSAAADYFSDTTHIDMSPLGAHQQQQQHNPPPLLQRSMHPAQRQKLLQQQQQQQQGGSYHHRGSTGGSHLPINPNMISSSSVLVQHPRQRSSSSFAGAVSPDGGAAASVGLRGSAEIGDGIDSLADGNGGGSGGDAGSESDDTTPTEMPDRQDDIDVIQNLSSADRPLNLCQSGRPPEQILDPARLRNITVLNIAQNRLTKLEHLPPCLMRLDASGNELSEIGAGLMNCRLLVVLTLRRNLLKRIDGLDHCFALKHLFLGRNMIQRVTGLGHILGLETLDISYNNIKKQSALRPLSQNTALLHLILYGNPVVDLNLGPKGSMAVRGVLRNLIPTLIAIDNEKLPFPTSQRALRTVSGNTPPPRTAAFDDRSAFLGVQDRVANMSVLTRLGGQPPGQQQRGGDVHNKSSSSCVNKSSATMDEANRTLALAASVVHPVDGVAASLAKASVVAGYSASSREVASSKAMASVHTTAIERAKKVQAHAPRLSRSELQKRIEMQNATLIERSVADRIAEEQQQQQRAHQNASSMGKSRMDSDVLSLTSPSGAGGGRDISPAGRGSHGQLLSPDYGRQQQQQVTASERGHGADFFAASDDIGASAAAADAFSRNVQFGSPLERSQSHRGLIGGIGASSAALSRAASYAADLPAAAASSSHLLLPHASRESDFTHAAVGRGSRGPLFTSPLEQQQHPSFQRRRSGGQQQLLHRTASTTSSPLQRGAAQHQQQQQFQSASQPLSPIQREDYADHDVSASRLLFSPPQAGPPRQQQQQQNIVTLATDADDEVRVADLIEPHDPPFIREWAERLHEDDAATFLALRTLLVVLNHEPIVDESSSGNAGATAGNLTRRSEASTSSSAGLPTASASVLTAEGMRCIEVVEKNGLVEDLEISDDIADYFGFSDDELNAPSNEGQQQQQQRGGGGRSGIVRSSVSDRRAKVLGLLHRISQNKTCLRYLVALTRSGRFHLIRGFIDQTRQRVAAPSLRGPT